MEEAGVKLVVKGLQSFISDMKSANSALQDLRPPQTLLQQGFGLLGDALGSFGSSIVRIAETTIGVLLRDAIRGAIDLVKELTQSIFDAGNEFQTLELRLERLNFNDLIESGSQYGDAQEKSIQLTQEQIAWLQKLAATTPFDSADVANLYTLARSYGFADDEARKLTETTINFSAGMGLSSDALVRIITNLGQLKAQGKLNGQELRDLARGAFVPVNDVMEIFTKRATEAGVVTLDFTDKIAEQKQKLGVLEDQLAIAIQKQEEFTDTTKESTRMANELTISKLRTEIQETVASIDDLESSTGQAMEITMENLDELKRKGLLAGDAVVDQFIGAFIELVDTRFSGAADKMSQTFKAATDNIKDLVVGIFGLNVVKPILDVLGQRAAAFADAFTKDPKKWDQIVAAATRLGEALASVVDGILSMAPGTENITDYVIDLINRAADWVETNKENIIGFFRNMADTIKNDVVPWIQENLIPAIQQFIGWVIEHKDEILQFFLDLGQTIMDDVIPFIQEQLIPLLQQFGQWFVDNREQILNLFDQLGDAILQLGEIYLPKILDAMQWITDNPDKVEKVINIWAKWQVVGTILNQVGGILIGIIGTVVSFLALGPSVISFLSVAGGWLTSITSFLGGLISTLAEAAGAFVAAFGPGGIGLILVGLVAQFLEFKFLINDFKIVFTHVADFAKQKFQEWKDAWTKIIDDIGSAIADKDWGALGKAIIDGIVVGFKMNVNFLLDAIGEAGDMIVEAFRTNLGIQSPSKVFAKFGQQTMEGYAIGIRQAAGLAAGSMAAAMTQVASVAAPSVTNSTTVNYNNNLTVNSNAGIEPILQDFEMLTSLAGG